MEEIASAIASGFPAAVRGHAKLVLVTSVLPWDLRGMASFADPRRLVDTAYAALVDPLRVLAPDERLPELEAQSRRRRSQQALDIAVAIAVARWALDTACTDLPAPWRAAAVPYRDLDVRSFRDEVARQLILVDDLEQNADLRALRLMRSYLIQARFTLRAADTGIFAGALGPLLVFLRDMGVATRDVTLEMQRPRTDRISKLRRPISVPPRANRG